MSIADITLWGISGSIWLGFGISKKLSGDQITAS
jgi:hypothetical protein